MIRDPSDGSVRSKPLENKVPSNFPGLRITKAKADYLAWLEEFRKWLKSYVRPTING